MTSYRDFALDPPLLKAQRASLSRDERIETLKLRAVKARVPDLNVAGSLLAARVVLTMEGASTLTLTVHDPDCLIDRAQLLDPDRTGRLHAVAVMVDTLRFRLVGIDRARGSTSIDIKFEDEVWALMRAHRSFIASSRGALTRAQFIERRLVGEIKFRDIPVYSPEKGRKQIVEPADLPSATPARGSTGFDKGTKLNVKAWNGSKILDAEAMRNAATMLTVAEQEEAGEKATLALIEAGIVEAPFFYNNPGGDRTSVGVLQLLNIHLGGSTSTNGGRRDVALVSRLFLTKGFSGKGGAIALARAHPDWSAGQIAQAVQGSAYPDRYDQSRDGARTVVDAWNGGGDDGGASTHEAVRIKAYRFTRGRPGQPENSAQCALRLAEEVNWRFFVMGGAAYFVTDHYLLTRPAQLVIDGFDAPGLLEHPGYRWDHRKVAAEAELLVAADAWSVRPGGVVVLRDMGPLASGRWLVESFEFDLLNPVGAEITLTKPLTPKKEPAPEAFTVTVGDGTPEGEAEADAPGGGGAKKAVAWARSKLGHYKEDVGWNRGNELDNLERGFGLIGQPWCAMFATTAVVMGGVTRDARHAAVDQIRAWCLAGTHGYQQGYRKTPRPGDLLATGYAGHAHIRMIEKVSGQSVTFIQGNGGASKVDRGTAVIGFGDYIRPDYPDSD